MAKRNSKALAKASSAKKQRSPAVSLLSEQDRQKLTHYDHIMEQWAVVQAEQTEREKRQAAVEAEISKPPQPTVISPENADRITNLLSEVVFSSVAINQLAVEAMDPSDDQAVEWLLVAIKDAAKVNARRGEVIHSLLTGRGPNFGNFGDELDVPERREAEAIHA